MTSISVYFSHYAIMWLQKAWNIAKYCFYHAFTILCRAWQSLSYFNCMEKSSSDVLLNIFFYVPQKKESLMLVWVNDDKMFMFD